MPASTRVAVVCATRRIAALDPGGAPVHLRGIAGGFADAGCQVELWTARASRGGDTPTASAPVGVTLREARRGHLPGVLRRRRAWDEGVDASAMARQARGWARRLRPDLIYERFALFSSIGARLRAPGRPWVLEVNAPVAWEAVWFEGARPDPALLRREEVTLRSADRVVVVSDALAAYVRRRGVEADRIDLLPNGVREPLAGVPAGADERGPFVLGYEGTFKPWQGLLEAVPQLRDLAAHVAPRPLVIDLWGDGPMRSAFVDRAVGLELQVRGWGRPDRSSWHAAWVPEGRWPPPGPGFDEPPPDRYFSPLKAAAAAAAGLPVFRGGRLHPPEPSPRSWTEIASAILARAHGSR